MSGCPVLGKLYVVIVDAQLLVCAEKNGWRSEGLAGFRAGNNTVDHILEIEYCIYILELRHMIEATHLERPCSTLSHIFKKAAAVLGISL
jgi:hypothetical protein